MALSDFSEKLSNIVKVLPNKPGVYQYFDADGKIIYVGKAKDLKKRVSSYFNKDQTQSGKVQVLVKRIRDIRFIVTNSEGEALLLENNLIKEFQPRYNILLKDDKTYPWIILKKEPFPRIFYTRNKIKDGSEYFGPFASVKSMHTLLELVHQTYPLRNCSLNLAQKYIDEGKYKVCLQYHIGKCLGPCQGLQSKDNYTGLVRAAREIIKGNISGVKAQLKEEMMAFAEKMEFEKAQYIKEKIERLENYQAKSVVVNPLISNVDVFSILSDEKSAFVNYLKVEAGAVIQAYTLELKKKLEESDEELLLLAVTELRGRFESTSTEVILPFQPETELPGITLTVPQRGDKKSLLELSERNAKYFRLEQEKQKDLVDPDRHGKRIIKQMQSDLRMPVAPDHIECFDNSNTQGSYPVASMVVFKNAKPDKKEYRHFNIK
ncbi:MAG TPA: excinuclease ABC subunit UvrC, partial [Bacteroidales bacterium]|nr:excinuclease ABC subunit UvrC [Bacteroidales bacterium]